MLRTDRWGTNSPEGGGLFAFGFLKGCLVGTGFGADKKGGRVGRRTKGG